MITNVAYIADNAQGLEKKPGMAFHADTLEKIKGGAVVGADVIDKIAQAFGKTIGEMLVKPGEDASRWADSSLDNILPAVSAYINAAKMPYKRMGALSGIQPSSFSQYSSGHYAPSLRSMQLMADFWQIEVADFFIPPDEANVAQIAELTERYNEEVPAEIVKKAVNVPDDLSSRISHRAFLSQNFRRLVERNKDKSADKRVRDIIELNTGTLAAIEECAGAFGATIGEVFQNPSIECNWYKETRLVYLSYNLEEALKDAGTAAYMIAAQTKTCNATVIYKYVNGSKIPPLERLQEIADVLNLDISDLFLPPDGGGYA